MTITTGLLAGRPRSSAAWVGTHAVWATVALATAMPTRVAAQELEQGLKKLAESNAAAARRQGRVDTLADAEARLEAEYREATRRAESLDVYVAQLEAAVGRQRAELEAFDDQIERINEISRRAQPLMRQMVDALDRFVGLDVPFLPDERRERIAKLRAMLDGTDSDADKYRRIIEAYEIEAEYGRTVGAYRGQLEDGTTVDFLRVGRVALLYCSLDRQRFGRWNGRSARFVAVDPDRKSAIVRALRVAERQVAPELLVLPIAAPIERSRTATATEVTR